MASGYSECSATGGHGRHGQIRTADLSLRRRPLYPSELRARNTLIVALQASAPDIRAVVHAIEPDQVRGGVRAVDGSREVRAGGGDAEHAASRRLDPPGALPGARLEDTGAGGFGGANAIDGLAAVERTGITAGCQHHAN